MKCYTARPFATTLGIKCKPRQSQKTGADFLAVEVGETGRGRKLGWVALHPNLQPVSAEDPRILSADLGKTKSGSYILLPESKASTLCLVDLYFVPGFRGWNEYDWDETTTKVLAGGYTAQGIAGRMGGGAHYLLLLHPGALITCTRGGRLHGRASRMNVAWDGSELVSYNPDTEPDCDLQPVEIIS